MPLPEPERRARRPRVEHEQAEVLADPPMVALLRFLDLVQVLLQVVVLEERRAVDALHRLVARVALPVRVRRRQQLERLQASGRRHVRPDAEVDEGLAVLDGVAGDLATGLRSSPRISCTLSGSPRFVKKSMRFLARPHLPLVEQVLAGQLAHLRFDLLEVLGHERTRRRRSRRRTLRRSPGRCRTARPGRAA